ncbi:hypothetical protein MMC21_005581 [Puttea exsequens]|nr:hypothetical protein [Puttea exsequens]
MAILIALLLTLTCWENFSIARSPPIPELLKRTAPECYPTRSRITYSDCLVALTQMSDDTHFQTFGRITTPNTEPPEIPANWTFGHGTCLIAVDRIRNNAKQLSTWLHVKRVAGRIAYSCVHGATPRAGFSFVDRVLPDPYVSGDPILYVLITSTQEEQEECSSDDNFGPDIAVPWGCIHRLSIPRV